MIPKKVGLFVIDTWRFDCVGYQPDKKYLIRDKILDLLDTPTLDKLSNESVCFTNCYSTSSTTTPVIASMFTGTTPSNHRIMNNNASSKIILNENLKTISEILKDLGYITVIGGDPPAILYGHKITRNFDCDFKLKDKELFAFLKKHKSDKIFLFAHFEDTHGPYLFSRVPPTDDYNDDYFSTMLPLLKQYNVPIPKDLDYYWHNLFKVDGSRKLWFPLYVKGVTKFDKGRFNFFISNLEKQNFLAKNDSLIIVTADHGEGKHTHDLDKFQHGADPYDEITKVPLIVRLPSLKHQLNNDLVSNADIFKIIVDICSENKTDEIIKYPLHCINPFLNTNDYLWYMLTLVPFDEDSSNYCIHARSIITKDKKYVLRGKPESLFDSSFFNLENNLFVRRLFFDLFGRRSSLNEVKSYTAQLDNNEISKSDLYEKFLNSNEYKRNVQCFILDTKNDIFEEQIYNPFLDDMSKNEFLSAFSKMIELERPDVSFIQNTVDEISKEQEEEIRKELAKLGYLD